MIICTDDVEMNLPTKNATVEQYGEEGRKTGRVYHAWWIGVKRNDWRAGKMANPEIDGDHLGEVYLPGLNEKMRPHFNPSDEQLAAFNEAAYDEVVRLRAEYIDEVDRLKAAGQLNPGALFRVALRSEKRAMKAALAG